MKKIAIIIPSYRPVPDVKGGGVEHLVTKIIDENEIKQQCYIDVFTIADPQIELFNYKFTNFFQFKKNYIENLFEKIINRICLILKIPFFLDFYDIKIKKNIHIDDYDYIVIENNMYLYKRIYRDNSNSKFIFHLHNDIGGRDKPKFLCDFINNTASIILTCSDFLTRRFIEITNSEKVLTLENYVDPKCFKFDNKERKTLRKKFNIFNEEIIYLYVGRISAEKGIFKLINIFSDVEMSNYKLFIVGDAEGLNKIAYQRFLNKIDCSKNIFYIGRKKNSDLYKFYSMADCVIVPTIIDEAFGLVAEEAMLCQKPLIVTNSGGLLDIIKNSDTYVIDRTNFDYELKNVLINKIKNNTQLKRFGKNNYNIISKKYNNYNYYDQFILYINRY